MCQYDMCVCCEALDLKQAFQLMVFFISELHFIMRVEYWLLCVCERVCDVAICTFDECVFVSQSHYHLFHIKLNLSSRLVIIIIVYTVCVCVCLLNDLYHFCCCYCCCCSVFFLLFPFFFFTDYYTHFACSDGKDKGGEREKTTTRVVSVQNMQKFNCTTIE